ncbi:uncharacterized protein LOC141812990 [Curcuma longa]|uniref:uncharacterized protein LOC141812990 n=1 Tax=Curcuma longa TaxID=136217 RepID=UPI003D9E0B97
MDLPWLLIGNFNSPLSPDDKGGGLDVSSHATEDFQEFAFKARVEDLHSTSCQFTWTNGHVICKLDRTRVNALWLEQDRSNYAEFRPPGVFSDHASCIVSILESSRRKAKPFKFFNKWTTHLDFTQIVQSQW